MEKFWVEPIVSLDKSIGFSAKELKFIKEIVLEKRQIIKEAWNEFFDGK